ncbi:MAG: hypothetical protein ACE5GA_06440 [Candidatus Zixiibacteriota bacterium]
MTAVMDTATEDSFSRVTPVRRRKYTDGAREVKTAGPRAPAERPIASGKLDEIGRLH